MAKKIEILENTLLKLLVRRGINADRVNVTLSEGELGYTTDTKRLFVGDGQTLGGSVVGNVYSGASNNVQLFTEALKGDFGFSTDTNKLYILDGLGRPEVFGDWREVGGVYTGDGTINVSSNNVIGIGTLSGGSINESALGNSIVLDEQGRISLNGNQISTDSIVGRTSVTLSLPQSLRINNISYNWPAGGASTNRFLKTDALGNLSWSEPTSPVNMFVAGEISRTPVGTILAYASDINIPEGWLLCNGQAVSGSQYPQLSATLNNAYGSTSTTFNVPNLINKTLYGVTDSPGTSDILRTNTDTLTSTLSSQGTVFIIKATPDIVVDSLITLGDGLTAVDGVIDVSQINPLTGSYTMGIDPGYITNLLTSSENLTGGIIIPSGLVSFSQSGDIKRGNNVSSVSLSSEAALTSVTGQSYDGLVPINSLIANRSGYRDFGLGSDPDLAGVYVVDFDAPIADHLNSVVQIQALNYRGTFTNINRSMHDVGPIFEYGWASSSRLVIGVITVRYGNSDSSAKGEPRDFFLDSGLVNPNTRFSVVVY